MCRDLGFEDYGVFGILRGFGLRILLQCRGVRTTGLRAWVMPAEACGDYKLLC